MSVVIDSKKVQRRLHRKMLTVVEDISEARRAKGLTQKDVGEGIGMDKGQMSRFMAVQKNSTIESVIKFEEYFGTDFLLTPAQRDEQLIHDLPRLKQIVGVAREIYPNEFQSEQTVASAAIGRSQTLILAQVNQYNFMIPSERHSTEGISEGRVTMSITDQQKILAALKGNTLIPHAISTAQAIRVGE